MDKTGLAVFAILIIYSKCVRVPRNSEVASLPVVPDVANSVSPVIDGSANIAPAVLAGGASASPPVIASEAIVAPLDSAGGATIPVKTIVDAPKPPKTIANKDSSFNDAFLSPATGLISAVLHSGRRNLDALRNAVSHAVPLVNPILNRVPKIVKRSPEDKYPNMVQRSPRDIRIAKIVKKSPGNKYPKIAITFAEDNRVPKIVKRSAGDNKVGKTFKALADAQKYDTLCNILMADEFIGRY